MRQQIEITVTPRQTGKHNSRAFRLENKVPAVIYGAGKENTNLLTDALSVTKYGGRKFESTIFKLKSEDGKLNGQAVLFKDVQFHPVTRRPVHVDFYAVDMNKPIRVNIEVKLEGKPIGLADGGMLQAVVREVEVEVLPTQIPEFLAADVSDLGVGDSLHVSDLKIPQGVRVITRGEQTLATVVIIAEEVVAPVVVAAVPGAEGAAPAAGAAAAPGAAPAAGAAAAPAADAKGAKK
jgi:large subunit ribosomal protein L25